MDFNSTSTEFKAEPSSFNPDVAAGASSFTPGAAEASAFTPDSSTANHQQ
jgi:hypothetical protein